MDVLPPQMSAKDEGCFAYFTMKNRIPQILTKVINALNQHKNEFFEKHGEAGTEAENKAVSLISKIRNELQADEPLLPLTDNWVDTDIWNKYLEYQHSLLNENNKKISWFHSPWLYVECYMYRRVHEALMLSSPISDFDVFKESKDQNFLESQEAIMSLCNYLEELNRRIKNLDEHQLKDEFFKLLQISLWGNKCDLSLSGGQSSSQMSSPLTALEDLKPFILVNNMDNLWSVLINRKKMSQEKFPSIRVDFVLDNAGFELVTDLVMADFLLTSKLATEIHFHGKSIPWYVSDTNKNDINWVLEELKAANTKCMFECGVNWELYFKKHTWIYQDHMFWTLPHEYCTMAQVAPDLYAELQKSNLILFKGDLNYRKLVADRKWEFTVPFHQALNGFHPAPLCSIRTVKAEVQVGLAPGQGEQVTVSDPNWMTTGKYGIFQFDGSV
ncbi:damage-control phosphatase ARMT1-like isoform X2 [Dromiciops gliroides]|uniref:damage-control phosphatase ARMT1-like isoform X2 n=1 Tax=Dromiciops gliroides TaxID=33562 RepID=UPI001CC416B8|nr:damage-control phosphatase ARMT1-like isoform X2 [Dromiciops gliroides]XP_043858441.1 damage-control phosphatase ARMT1-like isoform X2 [Dromiciops gliroides]